MNIVILIGRITAEPEIRMTQNGKKVCQFTLAINNGKDRPAQFIDCVAWENNASFLESYIHKGNRIAVNGRLDKSSYERDGQRFYSTKVVCDRVEYADGANQPQNEQTSVIKAAAPQMAQNRPAQTSAFGDFGIPQNIDIDSDDLPF